MHLLTIIFVLIFLFKAWGQYPPAAGQPESTAIHADSSIITHWANKCYIQRGYVDISNKSLGQVSYGTNSDAFGKTDNQVVSLGDSGIAVLSFPVFICDKPGFDFVVFENSFNGTFLELAFVEISSDSIHWFRFPSVSLTPTNQQVETFGSIQAEHIHNLAGKYKVLYGTPFDISEIADNANLNKQSIKYVKIIDVVGSINPIYASYDSQGNIINDPFPTPFNTGGFDLDAVGIINSCYENIDETSKLHVKIYPNPANEYIHIQSNCNIHTFFILNYMGKMVKHGQLNDNKINIQHLSNGIYTIGIVVKNEVHYYTFVKL